MKYTVDSLRPKLAQFLDPLLLHSGFDLKYELQTGQSAHPEVENPEVTVRFAGDDTDLLLANRAELLLAVEHLDIAFGSVPAVRDLSFSMGAGEALGLVGESGSGKSVTSLAVMRLLAPQARVSGSIRFAAGLPPACTRGF